MRSVQKHIDGIRALAALYVVFHHAATEIISSPESQTLSSSIVSHINFFFLERYAVDVFIVLSGYCLMHRVVNSGDLTLTLNLPGGFFQYIRRRFFRIYPPYFAALLWSFSFIALVPGMNEIRGLRWDGSLPAFEWNAFLSHLFLIQNLRMETLYKISYPLWTIATEWQIYFFLPLFISTINLLGNQWGWIVILMGSRLPSTFQILSLKVPLSGFSAYLHWVLELRTSKRHPFFIDSFLCL